MRGPTAFEVDPSSPTGWGRKAVLVLSASLAFVEVGRFAALSDAKQTMIAALAVLGYLPVHLWHLSYGLRGERPPRSVPTLCWMGLVHVAALLVLGPAWSFSLAALATSALVVLRPVWSFIATLACLFGAAVSQVISPDPSGTLDGTVGYLMIAVAFRSLLQFSLVWLVAATYRLAVAREALAAQAAAHERTRVNQLVREALEQNLSGLTTAADNARQQLKATDTATAQESLRAAGALSRATLASARRIVSSERGRDTSPVSVPPVPDTPIMAGIPRDRVSFPFVLVHLAVLGFLLAQFLGATTTADAPESRTAAFLGWLVLAAAQVFVATAVARGAVHRHRGLIWWGVVGVCIILSPLGGDSMNVGWWIAATTAIGLWGRDRRTAGAVAVAFVGLCVVELQWGFFQQKPGVLLWYVPYLIAISILAVAGLAGVALLVRRVDDLTRLVSVSAKAAADAERLRASRDVHDLLSQNFSAIALKSDLAGRLLTNGDVVGAERQVSEVVALANEQQARLRRAGEGFAETTVGHELTTATAILQLAGVQVGMNVDSGIRELDTETNTVLGRVVRETTTNVLRHAHARQVETRLVQEPDGIFLEIRNDGATNPGEWGSGLKGLAEAVEGIGGTFEARSGPDGTFVVTVAVPAR